MLLAVAIPTSWLFVTSLPRAFPMEGSVTLHAWLRILRIHHGKRESSKRWSYLMSSSGYLTPYCFIKVFEYGSPFYEYDCATAPGIVTILSTASGLAVQNVVTSVAEVTQTIASTSPATPVADSGNPGTSITNINNCGNDSSCGNGQGASGNNDGAGNGKSEAPMRTGTPSLPLILAWDCAGLSLSL